jgi:hypothetical protein
MRMWCGLDCCKKDVDGQIIGILKCCVLLLGKYLCGDSRTAMFDISSAELYGIFVLKQKLFCAYDLIG